MSKPARQQRKRLARAIQERAKEGVVLGPPKLLKPPQGHVGELVLQILTDASKPMSPMEVTREIERRFNETIPRATVTEVLRRGQHAKAGQIVQRSPR